jgi:hypothetical protein
MANNFPTIRPSLNMNFAGTGVLPPDVTFTRASSSGGYYDGVTVSKAEENLLLYSQDFSNAYWTKNTTSVTADSSVAPDGTSTADTLVSGAGVSPAKGAFRLFTIPASSTLSVYAKAGTSSIGFLTDSANRWAVYDLTAGTVLASNNGAASITRDATTGWCRLVFTPSVAITYFIVGGKDVYASGDPWSNGTWTEANNIIIWGAQLEQRDFATAYTPTTTQPITNYIPKMLFAPANVPVFDHNPTTGEALGLSVWEARTNLLQRSQEFDDAYWTKVDSTISANQIIAPDGTLTGAKFTEGSGTVLPQILRIGTAGSNVNHTLSVFAKAAERNWIVLNNNDGATSYRVWFNLTTGEIGVTAAGVTASIQYVGNGWYRCSVTRLTTVFSNSLSAIQSANADGVQSYTGDGVSGSYIWGAQLEAGDFATPYIPTVASTVARSADVAVMTGENFSRWFRADEGSFVAEFSMTGVNASAGGSAVYSVNDGTTSNRIRLNYTGSTTLTADIAVGGTAQVALTSTTALSTFAKHGLAYKTNDSSSTINGGAVGTDTVCTVPVVSQFQIGLLVSTGPMNGYIKSLSYYPARLTNAQLQAVTA